MKIEYKNVVLLLIHITSTLYLSLFVGGIFAAGGGGDRQLYCWFEGVHILKKIENHWSRRNSLVKWNAMGVFRRLTETWQAFSLDLLKCGELSQPISWNMLSSLHEMRESIAIDLREQDTACWFAEIWYLLTTELRRVAEGKVAEGGTLNLYAYQEPFER